MKAQPATQPSPISFTLTLGADAQERLAALLVDVAIPAQARPKPALLDRSDLAQALGCSPATVARLVRQGAPFVWLVDSRRFELEAVLAWLRERSREQEK